jgi:hypothetical protein
MLHRFSACASDAAAVASSADLFNGRSPRLCSAWYNWILQRKLKRS